MEKLSIEPTAPGSRLFDLAIMVTSLDSGQASLNHGKHQRVKTNPST